jgi:hypothetical protein
MQRDLYAERVDSNVDPENSELNNTSRATQNTRESKVQEASEGIDSTSTIEKHGCFDNLEIPKQNAVVFSAESDRTNSFPASSHEHNTSPVNDRP